jgi:hypothetical protein
MKLSTRFRKALLILLGVLLAVLVLMLDFPTRSSSQATPETDHALAKPVYRVAELILQTIHP